MSNLLKDFYSPQKISEIADAVQKREPRFNSEAFQNAVLANEWQELALKQRQARIAEQLYLELDIHLSYPDIITLLAQASTDFGSNPSSSSNKEDLGNFQYMLFPTVIEHFGLEQDKYWDENMAALELMTQHSSSEFAVRPFLLKYPEKMLNQMTQWSQHENYHVRRLASEGSRPRLPWGIALAPYKKNPKPILSILDTLKSDPSLYVRRSVANNINDISKDNPSIALDLAKKWIGNNADTDWLIKHGLRTLLKSSNQEALSLFGFQAPSHITLANPKLSFPEFDSLGQTEHISLSSLHSKPVLSFHFELEQTQKKPLGLMRVEFAIDFVKKSGKRNRKVFKISETNENSPNKVINKTFSFEPISTRKYYPGEHLIHFMVNGKILHSESFIVMV